MMRRRIRLISFLFFAVFSLISGCKKETDDAAVLFIGSWDQMSLTTIFYYDNVKQNETTRTYDAGEIVLKMYDNGTAEKFVRGDMLEAYYWKIEGDLLIMTGNNGIEQKMGFSINETDLNLQWAIQESTDGHTLRSDYMSIYKKQ